jgi:protein SCO1
MPRSRSVSLCQSPGASRRTVSHWLFTGALAGVLSACRPANVTPAKEPFRGVDITGSGFGRDFSLVDFNGQPRALADFRGKVVMLYFGFVQCPDVCPTALARANEVMAQLGAQAARVQLLFVTVDPERDTPALLREYMGAFNPGFVALTGSAEQIKAAADEFRVYYRKVPTGSTYTMDHTALTYLFDTQGHIRVALRHEMPPGDYLADVRTLLAESSA